MKKSKPKRYKFLIDLIKNKGYTIGAEIGCMKGNTSVRLLMNCPKLRLICVDLWDYDHEAISEYGKITYKDWNFNQILRTFKRQTNPYKNRLTVLRGISWEMAENIEDKSLDFIFIDADHSYESVKKDLQAWIPKVRKGGTISGHDIDIEGVRKAVDELVPGWIDSGINKVWYKCI